MSRQNTQRQLAERAAKLKEATDLADPAAEAALLRGSRKLYDCFTRDADWWYEQFQSAITKEPSRDDGPRNALLVAVLRTFLSERREVMPRAFTGPQVAPFQLNITCPDGAEIRRGTRGARDEAIEITRVRREELKRAGTPRIQGPSFSG